MPALGGESDQPDRGAARAGWTAADLPGTLSDAGEVSPGELASWYRRDDRGDLDHAIWDEDLDPSYGPPQDGVLAAGFTRRSPGAPGVGFAAGGALDALAPGLALAGFAAEADTAG